jgi:hypothetical protein
MPDALLAEFDSPDAIVRAHEELRARGYTRLRAWTPYPVRALQKRFGEDSGVAWIMLGAGLAGGALGYLIQWLCNTISYPINVGGRPLHSVPAFIPITFESAVLACAVTGFVALVAACGLPRLYHGVFEIDGFERASVDRFWLGIDTSDPRFEPRIASDLVALGALRCTRIGGAR